jgi:methyl-accepting chemotaxis protein
MNALTNIRLVASKTLIPFLFVNILLVAGSSLMSGNPWISATIVAVIFTAIPAVFWRLDPTSPATRYTVAVSLMVMPSLLVYMFRGHYWQIDVHMYYFAALAVTVLFCDWKTIVVSTVVVAVHHLALNFTIPSWVFPEGADFFRVVLHAVVVVVESAALVALALRLESAFMTADSAINQAEESQAEAQRLSDENRSADERNRETQQRSQLEMADHFEKNVGSVIGNVIETIDRLQSETESMSNVSKEGEERAASVSSISKNANENVQTVAAAVTELSASISEISAQVAKSTQNSSHAVNEVNSTSDRIQHLDEAAQKIGDVVNLITDIAEQTNLLALNATIEAARAGDAGKGFAVVASEVKNLANQTAKATEEISSQIANIQTATGDAVGAIGGIFDIMNQIDEISTVIASAVEEQNAATQEISRNVMSASDGTAKASEEMDEMAKSALQTNTVSTGMLTSYSDLQSKALSLQNDVNTFVSNIRQAN